MAAEIMDKTKLVCNFLHYQHFNILCSFWIGKMGNEEGKRTKKIICEGNLCVVVAGSSDARNHPLGIYLIHP